MHFCISSMQHLLPIRIWVPPGEVGLMANIDGKYKSLYADLSYL